MLTQMKKAFAITKTDPITQWSSCLKRLRRHRQRFLLTVPQFCTPPRQPTPVATAALSPLLLHIACLVVLVAAFRSHSVALETLGLLGLTAVLLMRPTPATKPKH